MAVVAVRTIYALLDPRNNLIRYVGQTKRGAEQRANDHVKASARGEDSYKARWIRELLALGMIPELEVLENGAWTQESTDDRERYWIANFRESSMARLTNTTPGGSGYCGRSRSVDEKTAQSNALKEWYKTPAGVERRAQTSARSKKMNEDPSFKALMSETFASTWKTPEGRQALSDRQKKYFEDPAHREAQSVETSKRWADTDYRARVNESMMRTRYCNDCSESGSSVRMGRHLKSTSHGGWHYLDGGES